MYYHTKYIIGTESSVSLDYVMGLELHHPIMSTLWEHGDQSKINKIKNLNPHVFYLGFTCELVSFLIANNIH